MNMFLLLLKGGYEKYVIAIYCDKMILWISFLTSHY